MSDFQLEQLQKLRKDIKNAAATLSATEARFLVDSYYIMQEDRKRAHNQERALDEEEEPHEIITWLAGNSRMLENEIKKVLEVYAASKPVGVWMQSLVGIGPVISAGMLAHIDINKCPTVGHIWRFAGLDPTVKWLPKTKRPWNAGLKTLCWKVGQSMMKLSNNEKCFYGKLYRERKVYEIARNDRGDNAKRAAEILAEKNIGKATEAYKHLTSGKLPPAHIDAQARRWMVKMFLSHLQLVWWWETKRELPPVPFPIAHLGHADFVPPPNLDMFPDLRQALKL